MRKKAQSKAKSTNKKNNTSKIKAPKQSKKKTIEKKIKNEKNTTTNIMIGGKKAKVTKVGNVNIISYVRPKRNKEIESRIADEYTVDAYGEEERAIGWYYGIENKMNFPFTAKCIKVREVSPLELGEKVEVIGMASMDECHAEIFVKIRWNNRNLAVPLVQLQGIKVDNETKEAIEDWHYWKNQGHEY